MEMDHKGLNLWQQGGEGKWAKMKFEFLCLALLFASFSSLGFFFILIISQRKKPKWKNLPSLLTYIQINVCRVLQIHKVCFMLVPSLWAEISDTVTEQVSSSQRKESAAIVGNNWRCCCYLLLPKNKDSKL